MKEILGRKIQNFEQSPVDPLSVPFREKVQEKQRQERLRQQQEEALSAEEAAKRARAEERRKAKEKAKAEKERTRTQKRRAKRNERANEWQLLAAEERLAKKLRRGKITASQFKTNLRKATKRVINKKGGDSASECDDEDSDDVAPGKAGGKDENASWLLPRRKRRSKRARR